MNFESFCRYPGGIEKSLDPLEITLLRLTTTQQLTPQGEDVKIVKQSTQEQHFPIHYKEYGISEPVVARTITATYELGLFRDPVDIITFLKSYKSSPNKPERPTILGTIEAVFDKKQAEEFVELSTFTTQLMLGQLYDPFSQKHERGRLRNIFKGQPVEIIQDLTNFIHTIQIAAERSPEKTLTFIDTFVKTYVGIRRMVTGKAYALNDTLYSEKERQELCRQEATSMIELVDHMLEKFRKEYDDIFDTKTQPLSKDAIISCLASEMKSGLTFLQLHIQDGYLPQRDRITQNDPSNWSRQLMQPMQHEGDRRMPGDPFMQQTFADTVKTFYTWDNQVIQGGSISGCPVFMYSWMKQTS